METVNLTVQDTSAAPPAEPTLVTFAISDSEVLQALSEYPEGPSRTAFLLTALKVGVLSLKVARGTIDADSVRLEGERLLASLGERLNSWRGKLEERIAGSISHYFDPQQGIFTDRVNRLTHADGDLALVMRQQVKDAESNLSKVFDQFIGENSQLLRALDPSGENHLVKALQRAMDEIVKRQNEAILSQFSLDNKESALVRLMSELSTRHGDLNQALSKDMQAVVAEFSLDKEDSALSRLVTRVETAQRSLTSELSLDNESSSLTRLRRMIVDHQESVIRAQTELAGKLDAAVQALQARKQEAAKSTRHGIEFETALGDHLRGTVQAAGDLFDEVGTTTGVIPNCKVGDYVVTVGPEKAASGARIVMEAKENAAYDLSKTLDEADVARRNRKACVCVFVHSAKTCGPTIPTFARYGSDLVVKWSQDESASDVWLQAAMMVAHMISVRVTARDKGEAASFDRIDKAIEAILKHIDGFEEIATAANTAEKAAERIGGRVRIMKKGLQEQIDTISEEFLKVKQLPGQA